MAQIHTQVDLTGLAWYLLGTDSIFHKCYVMDSLGNQEILQEIRCLPGKPTAIMLMGNPDAPSNRYAAAKLPIVVQLTPCGRVAAWHNMDSMRMVGQQTPEIWPTVNSFIADLQY